MIKTLLGASIALFLLTTAISAQGTLSLEVQNGPASFAPGPHPGGTPGATVPELVFSEAITLSLTSTPTSGTNGAVLPRAILALIGSFLPAGTSVGPFNNVYLDSANPFIFAIDSFANPGHPSFGPGLNGVDNQVLFSIRLNNAMFLPGGATFVVQAFSEDDPAGGFLLSGAVPFDIIAPSAGVRALTLSPLAATPAPVDVAGGSFSVEGPDLLVQSDWIQFPPTVRLTPCDGGALLHSDGTWAVTLSGSGATRSLSFLAPALPGPIDPPRWTVEVQNNLVVDPGAAFALAPDDLIYDVPAPTISNVTEVHTFGVQSDFNITGTGFRRGMTVEFRNAAAAVLFSATPVIANDTTVAVTVPDGVLCDTGLMVFAINCDNRDSGGTPFAAAAPSISALTEVHDPVNGGSSFTVTGSGFRSGMSFEFRDPGTGAVIDSPALTVVDSTTATFSVAALQPAVCTASMNAVAINCDQQESAPFLHSVAPPTITSFVAVDTALGVDISLTGTGFRHGMGFEIRNSPTTTLVPQTTIALVDSMTTATVSIPCLPPATIIVQNCDGQRSPGLSFAFPAPVIATLTPAIEDVEGGTLITIQGSGFRLAPTLVLEDIASGVQAGFPPLLTFIDSNTLSFLAPPACAGNLRVRVANCDGLLSNPALLSYSSAPATLDLSDPGGNLPNAPVPVAASLLAPGVTLKGTFLQGTSSLITLKGTNFFGLGSALGSAFNLPAGQEVDTRLFLRGVEKDLSPLSWYLNRTTLSGILSVPTASPSTTVVPEIGLGLLEVLGPDCAVVGAAARVGDGPILVQHSVAPTIMVPQPNVSRPTGSPLFNGSLLGQVIIRGNNLFSNDPNVTSFTLPAGATANFIDPTIPSTVPNVPLVKFGSVFAPYVEVRPDPQSPGQWMIVCSAPDISPVLTQTTVQVTVINPDLQESNPQDFTYLPEIAPTPNFANLRLDEAALQDIIANPTTWAARGVRAIRNPCPNRDQNHDPFFDQFTDGLTPPGTLTLNYNLVFLFETSDSAGAARHHTFSEVDVPAHINVPAGQTAMDLGFIGDANSTTFSLPSGDYRVIFKAGGFDKLGAAPPNYSETVSDANNHPFVLASKGDLVVAALVQMSGDAFVLESDLTANNGSSGLRTRVLTTAPPPAGGGRGGQGGGGNNPFSLTMTSPANLLNGQNGAPPTNLGLAAGTTGEGHGGGGASLLPFSLRSGTGGGHATPGGDNPSGSPTGGAIATASNEDIFGGNAGADYLGFNTNFANTLASFFGGSGGGGGGGSASVQSSSVVLGGRGGHGGGALILLSDLSLVLAEGGAITTRGEQGHLGIQVFPAFLGNPLPNVLDMARGGSGASGTIYGLANVTICIDTIDNGTTCPPGRDSTSLLANLGPFISAELPPILETSPSNSRLAALDPSELNTNPGLLTLLSGAGGTPTGGGLGRIRLAVNNNSIFAQAFETLMSASSPTDIDGLAIDLPSPPALSPHHYRFPSP